MNTSNKPYISINFQQYINNFYKKMDKFFEYSKREDKIIHLNLDKEINFGYFYSLVRLIKYGHEEIIYFTYDFDFIEKAYEFLIEKSKDKRIQIMGIKIINDLIYNYKITHEKEEYSIYQEKIEKIKATIKDLYKNILSKNKEIVEEFNLPKDFINLDIKKIMSKIITDLFIKSDFQDYENIYSILYTYSIDEIFIDEDIIEEIKNIINSNDFKNKFLITEADLIDLENSDIKIVNNFHKKINLLYILLVNILNEPSDFENFPFLIKTSSLFNDIFNKNIKEEILSRLDKGTGNKFSKIMKIFEDINSLL